MRRLLNVAVFIPLAIVLIALAVANRAAVPFTIDPFNPGTPGLTVQWPLFAYLFCALLVGLIIGSVATWLRQGQYRKLARERANELQALRQGQPVAPAPVSPASSAAPALPRPGV